jgi:RNA polymerase sigma-70 factor (ECF subfamily)
VLKSVFAHLFWDASPQEGERLEAFQSFYAEFYDYVRRVLFWMVPENALDDLCQEVFLKIWKSRNGFKSEASPKTWVYRIAVNAAHDYHRKHRRVFESFEDTEFSKVMETEKRLGLQRLIQAGVSRLSPKLRAVFVLFYKEELGSAEIAAVLKIPEGTVKSRLHEARCCFTEFLKKSGVSYEE